MERVLVELVIGVVIEGELLGQVLIKFLIAYLTVERKLINIQVQLLLNPLPLNSINSPLITAMYLHVIITITPLPVTSPIFLHL